MSIPVFRREHRTVVVSFLLLIVGGLLLTGIAVADHTDGNPASGDIEGQVTNAAGDPVQGATVNITRYDDLETTTDSSGEYSFEDVPFEDQTLRVTHTDYETTSRSVSVSTTNSPVTENFVLERTTGTISGTAVSSTGEINGNIPGVDIEVSHTDSGDQAIIDATSLDSTATTDDNGNYAIEVPTGELKLTATQDGFEPNKTPSIIVTADSTTTVDPEMVEHLTTVSGSVENTNGDGIRDGTVEVAIPNPDIWPGLSLANTTDASGNYIIENVPVSGNSRTIEADATNFAADSTTRAVTSGGATVDFELEHNGGALQGTITDTHGNALRGIDVTVDGQTVQTDTNGEYVFSELPFGTHEMTVTHEDYGTQTKTVEIKEGETTEPDTFELTRTTPVDLSIDSISPDFWQPGDEVTVKYSFNEDVYETVEFSVDGPQQLQTNSFDVGYGNSEAEATFSVPDSVEDGQYTVTLSALGANQTDSASVSSVYDAEGVEFSQPDYQSPAGDFVEVSLTTGDLSEAYIMIGGDRDSDDGNHENYFDVLRVTGDATIIINTRLLGTDRPKEDVYIPVSGGVESYAYDLGAGKTPQGAFDGVSFEDENGNQVATTLAEYRTVIGQSPRGSPLQPGRFQLVAGGSGTILTLDNDVPDFRHPVARSNLILTPPEMGTVTTYTLPPGPADQLDQFEDGEPITAGDIGSLLGEATETDRVTRGDRILIEVNAAGMYGALFDQNAGDHVAVGDGGGSTENIPAGWIHTLLERHEGVDIELSTTEFADANHRGSDLQFENVDTSDLYVLADDTASLWNDTETLGDDPIIGGFYLVIDTRGDDPFSNQPQDGDELTFDIAYESPDDSHYQYKDYTLDSQPNPFDPDVEPDDGVEHFPYFGPSDTTVSASDSFRFEEPFINYEETTLDGELIVGAESSGFIRGQTNIAPGSQAEIQLVASNRPNPEVITIEDVTIDEDRAFDVTADFSGLEPGERVEVEFYSQGRLVENRLLDRRGVRVVEDLDNPATFEIRNLTDSVTVERGQRLSEIESTIVNTGDVADRQLVEFEINGQTVRNQSIVLDSGEQTTLGLSEEFVVLSPGEYTYTVRTEDDEQTGQLTVTGTEDTEINSVEGSDPTTNERPEDEDDGSDESGLFGLIGLQRRDVAVAAAVTGAMHILGQWS